MTDTSEEDSDQSNGLIYTLDSDSDSNSLTGNHLCKDDLSDESDNESIDFVASNCNLDDKNCPVLGRSGLSYQTSPDNLTITTDSLSRKSGGTTSPSNDISSLSKGVLLPPKERDFLVILQSDVSGIKSVPDCPLFARLSTKDNSFLNNSLEKKEVRVLLKSNIKNLTSSQNEDKNLMAVVHENSNNNQPDYITNQEDSEPEDEDVKRNRKKNPYP